MVRRDERRPGDPPPVLRGERVQYHLRAGGEPVTGILLDLDERHLRVRPQGSADGVQLDRMAVEKLEVWRKRPTLGGAVFGAVLLAPVGILAGGLCDFQGSSGRSCTRDQIQAGLATGAIGGLIGYGLFRSTGWVRVDQGFWRQSTVSLEAVPKGAGARITVRF